MLDVERTVDVKRLLAAAHQPVHLRQRLIGQLHHLVQMVVLSVGEVVFLAVIFARDGSCHVVAGIANTLQLRNLAKHGTNFGLGVIRQVGIADGVQILGNFQLHVVRDTLVFLNAGKQFVEVTGLVVVLVARTGREGQQFAYHTEHALHTFRERLNLLLCLQHRELRGLHEASRNEVQAEVLFFVHLLGLDDPADELFNLGDKPYQDERVSHVECRVEGSQHEAQLGGIGQEGCGACGLFGHVYVIAYPSANHVDERTEDKQYPEDTEDVEEHVGQSGTAGLGVGRHRRQIGSDGGSNVLTHHKRNTLIDGQCTARTEYHGDGHDGCR